jgi:hypothetical protein
MLHSATCWKPQKALIVAVLRFGEGGWAIEFNDRVKSRDAPGALEALMLLGNHPCTLRPPNPIPQGR